jgi:hypothetical protein
VSLREVIAAVRAAVAEPPLAQLDDAEDALDEFATQWEHATSASHDPARDEVHALLENAKDKLRAVRIQLNQVPSYVESFIAGLGGAVEDDSPPVASEPATRPSMDDLVERARADLPPPVSTMKDGSRRTTHGRLLDADGTFVDRLISGRDNQTGAVDRLLAEAGSRRPLGIAVHVELKALLWMRERGRRSAILVQNNIPCTGPFGCDELLPEILRPGETLTVHGPDGYRKTFRRAAP